MREISKLLLSSILLGMFYWSHEKTHPGDAHVTVRAKAALWKCLCWNIHQHLRDSLHTCCKKQSLFSCKSSNAPNLQSQWAINRQEKSSRLGHFMFSELNKNIHSVVLSDCCENEFGQGLCIKYRFPYLWKWVWLSFVGELDIFNVALILKLQNSMPIWNYNTYNKLSIFWNSVVKTEYLQNESWYLNHNFGS